jgi:hypothetical protein
MQAASDLLKVSSPTLSQKINHVRAEALGGVKKREPEFRLPLKQGTLT